ncbi:hypothetical protein BD414DRAFT_502503 [Trametes punicea]|nr:hypothetical protein BD414DRAFT_502503 [Trametes punicea]
MRLVATKLPCLWSVWCTLVVQHPFYPRSKSFSQQILRNPKFDSLCQLRSKVPLSGSTFTTKHLATQAGVSRVNYQRRTYTRLATSREPRLGIRTAYPTAAQPLISGDSRLRSCPSGSV